MRLFPIGEVESLTVCPAASLAGAKKLGCKDNSGLPEKLDPDLRPVP